MESNLKIAVVGCGKQAEKHISAYKGIEDTYLTLVDIDEMRAGALAEKHGFEYTTDLRKVLNDDSVIALDICTPSSSHYSIVKESLFHQKHVFCEKPLCSTLEQAEDILEISKSNDCIVIVGYIYRFVAVFQKASEILASEEKPLGKPLMATFRIGGRGSHEFWKHDKDSGGGALNEMLVHMLDVANWFFGPLENICVEDHALLKPERVINGKNYSVSAEDYLRVTATGKDDVRIEFITDLISSNFSQYIEVQCEKGCFFGSIVPSMPSFIYSAENCSSLNKGENIIPHLTDNLYLPQMKYFVDCISKRTEPFFNTVNNSIEVMKTVNSIRVGMETK